MEEKLSSRLKHAWNVFRNKDPTFNSGQNLGVSYGSRPDRPRYRYGVDQTIISSIYTRIAIDCSSVDFKHCRLDDKGRYKETLKTGLNECLSLRSNIDQTCSAFIQDVVISLCDEGCVAIVPVDTKLGSEGGNPVDILTLRTAKIIEWMPRHVRVRIYNDRTGQFEEIVVAKESTAIVQNPLYPVMNEPNSTLARLRRKLNLLDQADEATVSGKLDLIIQLPYSIRNEMTQKKADRRQKSIEDQLNGSKYGIAYIDATEKVTQLNRPVENTFMPQVEYLTGMLYSQLGMTDEVLKGTADEATMLNYYNRTINPILDEIVRSMRIAFLSKTARTQGQSIMYFRDPFKLVPTSQIADIADKLTRNEIFSSNEVRSILGRTPVDDPAADELRNKNLNKDKDAAPPPSAAAEFIKSKTTVKEEKVA